MMKMSRHALSKGLVLLLQGVEQVRHSQQEVLRNVTQCALAIDRGRVHAAGRDRGGRNCLGNPLKVKSFLSPTAPS